MSASFLISPCFQFLDEADLLGDTIAVLAAPGKLVAQGTPVALKSRYGDGYNIQVSFDADQPLEKPSSDAAQILEIIKPHAPGAFALSASLTEVIYYLQTKDPAVVHDILEGIQQEQEAGRVKSYSVTNTSMEDVFLTLMAANERRSPGFMPKQSLDELHGLMDDSASQIEYSTPGNTLKSLKSHSDFSQKTHSRGFSSYSLPVLSYDSAPVLALTNGRPKSVFSQAWTVFYKRCLIVRRSWLSPLLMILITLAGSAIPLWFLQSLAAPTCVQPFKQSYLTQLYVPQSPLVWAMSKTEPGHQLLQYPPGLVRTLGSAFDFIPTMDFTSNTSFVDSVTRDYRGLAMGGVSIDYDTGATLIAWEATAPPHSFPGATGLSLFNLASNLLYNHALNETNVVATRRITANFEQLVAYNTGILVMLKFMAFFGATLVSPTYLDVSAHIDHRAGGLPGVLWVIRVEGTAVGRPSHAILQRLVEPSWSLAWASHVRCNSRRLHCNSHCRDILLRL